LGNVRRPHFNQETSFRPRDGSREQTLRSERQQAADLLSPVYGKFTEGFDTLDLKEAMLLLDRLRA
jgi:hypothetical protein